MTRAATPDEINDRRQDERKNWQPEFPNAREIISICRGLGDEDAAALIQKYADTFSAIRVNEAVSEAYTRVIHTIEGKFHPAEDHANA